MLADKSAWTIALLITISGVDCRVDLAKIENLVGQHLANLKGPYVRFVEGSRPCTSLSCKDALKKILFSKNLSIRSPRAPARGPWPRTYYSDGKTVQWITALLDLHLQVILWPTKTLYMAGLWSTKVRSMKSPRCRLRCSLLCTWKYCKEIRHSKSRMELVHQRKSPMPL